MNKLNSVDSRVKRHKVRVKSGMQRLRYMGNTHGMFSDNNLPWELPE